jgi:hypothetical protein
MDVRVAGAPDLTKQDLLKGRDMASNKTSDRNDASESQQTGPDPGLNKTSVANSIGACR